MDQRNTDLDANEPATPFKLEKARQRGSIVRSGELVFACVLLSCVAYTFGLGLRLTQHVAELMRNALSFSGRSALHEPGAIAYLREFGGQAVASIAPVIFVIWLVAMLVAALQARGVFSAHPLKPDFARLNPLAGLKRVFSIKSLHDLWRNVAKLVCVTIAMTIFSRHQLGRLLAFQGETPSSMVGHGIDLLGSALALLAGILFAFALLDFGINYFEYRKKMRMSKRELKDEHKEREGDPRIKKRLRELRIAWLKRARQLAKIRNADVLLTNPTHYAVALQYRHGEMPAPQITARGAGEIARRMRIEARRHRVPVVENAPLTRALFAQPESESFVAAEHFDAIARILRWVYAARGQHSLKAAS